MKEYIIITRVDAIRSKSTLGLPTPPQPPPDKETPPSFPAQQQLLATSTGGAHGAASTAAADSFTATRNAVVAGNENAPLEIQDVPPVPSTDSTVKSVDSSKAVAAFWTAVKACFVTAPSTFANQHVYNQKAQKMAALSTDAQLKKHANKTLEILTTDGISSGKVVAAAEYVVQQ
jgi:hypothetical protein